MRNLVFKSILMVAAFVCCMACEDDGDVRDICSRAWNDANFTDLCKEWSAVHFRLYTARGLVLFTDMENKLLTQRHRGHGDSFLRGTKFPLCGLRAISFLTAGARKKYGVPPLHFSVFSVSPWWYSLCLYTKPSCAKYGIGTDSDQIRRKFSESGWNLFSD
jgi:hypothetical protein